MIALGLPLGVIASPYSDLSDASYAVAMAELDIERAASQSKYKQPPVSEKLEVLRQAKNYAKSTACTTTFERDSEDNRTDVTDVHLVESQSSFDSNNIFGTRYIVYWRGDNACAGGSGTYMGFITSFERDREKGEFVARERDIVDTMDFGNNNYDINSRFMEAVSYNDGILSVISSDYGNDGSNSPRYKYLYTVVYKDFGWQLVGREMIADLYEEYR